MSEREWVSGLVDRLIDLFLPPRNVIFAPAQHDQYSGSCFPGVTDALYDVIHNKKTDWTSVEKQLSVLSYHILQATRAIS